MADRLCYGASFTWSHVYCLTAEDLMDVEVPERAKYIRIMSDELQRIGSHLMWLAAIGPDLGNLTIFLYAMRERELFLDLFQNLTGARMTYNYRASAASGTTPRPTGSGTSSGPWITSRRGWSSTRTSSTGTRSSA